MSFYRALALVDLVREVHHFDLGLRPPKPRGLGESRKVAAVRHAEQDKLCGESQSEKRRRPPIADVFFGCTDGYKRTELLTAGPSPVYLSRSQEPVSQNAFGRQKALDSI